jgi:hypothetical protein
VEESHRAVVWSWRARGGSRIVPIHFTITTRQQSAGRFHRSRRAHYLVNYPALRLSCFSLLTLYTHLILFLHLYVFSYRIPHSPIISGRSLKSFRACWLKPSLLGQRDYEWQFNVQYTCPVTGITKLPMGMSAYKLVATMNNDPNALDVDLAFGKPFPKSAISTETLLKFQQTTNSRHFTYATRVHVLTLDTYCSKR